MATSIYIAGTQARSGKSAVAVGLLEQLSRRAGRVGVFRPIVRAGEPDELVRTLLARLPGTQSVEQACGVTYDDLHDAPERAMGAIVDRFHDVHVVETGLTKRPDHDLPHDAAVVHDEHLHDCLAST